MKVEMIRKLNDNLRQNLSGGRVMLTKGVMALSIEERELLFCKVRNFSSFNENNDPYNEHDFGCVDFKDEQYFWKVDYYDINYQAFSLDASDETITNRVLTIMRAEEY